MADDLQKLYGTVEALKTITAALADAAPGLQKQVFVEDLRKTLGEKQSMAETGKGRDFIWGDVGLNAFINTLDNFLSERDEKRLS